MEIRQTKVVLDAADAEVSSAFWAAVLGGTVEADGDWYEVVGQGRLALAIQEAPDHEPPDWPDGRQQQVHLDLHVPDVEAAHAEVVGLGARVLQQSYDASAPEGFWVYADPAGHPFCLCW